MIVKISMDGQLTDEVAHFEYDGTGESKGVIDFGMKAFRPYRFENIKTTGKHHNRTRAQLCSPQPQMTRELHARVG